MSAIEDIIVQVLGGPVTVSRVGFGIPVVLGTTGQRSVLISGAGTQQIIYKSVARNATLAVNVANAAYSYSFGGGVVNITVPVDSTVRDLVADFNANAPGTVTAVLSLEIGTTGSGAVVLLPSDTDLEFESFREIVDISQLQFFYDTTDAEFIMFQNMLAGVPTPVRIFLIDSFSFSTITSALSTNDDGRWFAVLTNETTEAEQQEINDYVTANKRIALFVTDDVARLAAVKGNVAFVVHDDPDTHPEASWAARNLPQDPGSITWKWTPDLFGQIANATATLSELLAVRNANGQSYIKNNGVSYVDEGVLNSLSSTKTFIDQLRSRLFIEFNLTADLQELFINASGAGEKIPYTDAGIDQIGAVIATRLELAGAAGIIAPIENAAQAEVSTSSNFRFRISLPSREDIAADKPNNITNRLLEDVTFSYVEAGAIHEVKTITGRVILSET